MLGVIGDLAQDVVVTLKEEIRPATDTECDISIRRGGSAANTAAFAGMRYPTRFIGCVGDDLAGVALTEELQSKQVDVRLQVADVSTATIVVMIDLDGERKMFPSREASSTIKTIDDEWLKDLEILHITGYSLENEPTKTSVLEACRKVRKNGGKISMDVSSTGSISHLGVDKFKEMIRGLAPDIISANEDETDLLDINCDDAPGEFLAELSPETIVLSRAGSEPTRIFQGGKLVSTVRVIPAEVVKDTTGAGDSFNGAFLASYLREGNLVKAVEDAHALARRVLGFSGASEG